MEINGPPPIVIPKLCSKCRNSVDENGWCEFCAKQRRVLWGVLLIGVIPLLGFGTCLSSVFWQRADPALVGFLTGLGALVCCTFPIIGVIYIIVSAYVHKRRR